MTKENERKARWLRFLVFTIAIVTIGMGLLIGTARAYYPTDDHGNPLVPVNLNPECKARNDTAIFVYDHREQVTQDEALEIVEKNWTATWSKTPGLQWSDYVDMQRIVRDAYRTDSRGEYVRECCNDELILVQVWKETFSCMGDDVDAIPVTMDE